MNATSAGDAHHPPTSRIPGPRRPGSRMKRMHTTSTKKTPQQESTPHTTTEATEDPTTPKAKRVRPTSRAEDSPMNTDMDEDDSEKEENPGIPRFLFSGTTTQGSDSIQRMDKLRKLLKEALSVASALANAPSSSIHWDQTTTWLTERLFQIVNADFHETQKARHNEIIETMAKLTADVELLKNTNLHSRKQTIHNPTKGLEESIHKPSTYAQAAAKVSQQNQEANPNRASHPSRLIIAFENGVPVNNRRDPILITNDINKFLAENIKSQHIKVTAIKWNHQGNCILYTRSDQRAADLLIFSDVLPCIIAPGHSGLAREDKKWYKIEIAGIRTGLQDGVKGAFPSQQIHSHLCENNPEYAKASIALLPRWIRPPTELGTQGYSSVVFAVDDKNQHMHLLKNVRTLAAWGRIVHLREWMDRPPITQCRQCWKFGHVTANCQETPKCRLCYGDHEEAQHPQVCTTCKADTSMDVDGNHPCPHYTMSCTNCKTEGIANYTHPSNWTRCPTRLRKLGEAREQPKYTPQSRPTRRKVTQKTTTPPFQQPNRYSALEIAIPSIDTVTQEANTRGFRNANPERTQQAMTEVTNTLTS